MAREVQVTFDCADPAALATFWAEVLGYVCSRRPPGSTPGTQALDAWGVPPEQRNDALGAARPRRRRPAGVLPAGAGGQDGQEPACTSTSGPRPA